MWHSQQRVDELPTHGCSAGGVGSSVATDDGDCSTSRAGDRVIAEPGQRCREHEQDTDRRVKKPTTIEGRRATLPEELVGQHATWRFANEVAAWLVYVDPKHEAGQLIQRITKKTGHCDGRCSEVHSAEGHSCGAKSRVRGMASTGRRLCAQVIE